MFFVMATITIYITKESVWNEVCKVSEYAGAKMTGDDGAYRRITLTEADKADLQLFWEESVAEANAKLKELLTGSDLPTEDFEAELEVSECYNEELTPSVRAAISGYLVRSVLGRWYRLANKEEADGCLGEAASKMEEALRMLYHRKRPRRPGRE